MNTATTSTCTNNWDGNKVKKHTTKDINQQFAKRRDFINVIVLQLQCNTTNTSNNDNIQPK